MQTWLSIEQNETVIGIRYLRAKETIEHLLSVLQMTLHDPPILQERVRAPVVPKIDPLSGITDDISSAWIRCWAIPHKFLKIRDIVRGD